MSTKLIVIGAKQPPQKKLVPIEFLSYLEKDHDNKPKGVLVDMDNPHDAKPNEFNYIELVCRDYFTGIDLMYAYDDGERRDCGMLIIGKWNDGVVE